MWKLKYLALGLALAASPVLSQTLGTAPPSIQITSGGNNGGGGGGGNTTSSPALTPQFFPVATGATTQTASQVSTNSGCVDFGGSNLNSCYTFDESLTATGAGAASAYFNMPSTTTFTSANPNGVKAELMYIGGSIGMTGATTGIDGLVVVPTLVGNISPSIGVSAIVPNYIIGATFGGQIPLIGQFFPDDPVVQNCFINATPCTYQTTTPGGWSATQPYFAELGSLQAEFSGGLGVCKQSVFCASPAPTTGTIAGGTLGTVTGTSTSGVVTGSPVTIVGAGPSSGALITTVATIVSGSSFTLTTPASQAVTNAVVTFADATTASVSTGSATSFTVASPTGIAANENVTISGAGTAGATLQTTISGVSGTTITIPSPGIQTTNASATVTAYGLWANGIQMPGSGYCNTSPGCAQHYVPFNSSQYQTAMSANTKGISIVGSTVSAGTLQDNIFNANIQMGMPFGTSLSGISACSVFVSSSNLALNTPSGCTGGSVVDYGVYLTGNCDPGATTCFVWYSPGNGAMEVGGGIIIGNYPSKNFNEALRVSEAVTSTVTSAATYADFTGTLTAGPAAQPAYGLNVAPDLQLSGTPTSIYGEFVDAVLDGPSGPSNNFTELYAQPQIASTFAGSPTMTVNGLSVGSINFNGNSSVNYVTSSNGLNIANNTNGNGIAGITAADTGLSIAAISADGPTTTGSITTGTNQLTVASPTGFANGVPVTVVGAGAAGANLVTTESGAPSGSVITLVANASTTVSGAAVANSLLTLTALKIGVPTGVSAGDTEAGLSFSNACPASGPASCNYINQPQTAGANVLKAPLTTTTISSTAFTASTSITDSALSTAGLVTTTSGGLLGSEASATVPQGGTGLATLTAHDALIGEGTSNVGLIAGGTNCLLYWTASSSDPTCATTVSIANIGSTTPGTAHFTTLAANSTVNLTGLTTDTAIPDSTVCQATTGHQLYFGSGTLGVCAGTSSARFKTDVRPAAIDLPGFMQLQPKTFRYIKGYGDDGAQVQQGFLAEDVEPIYPDLVGKDAEGRATTLDGMGLVMKTIPVVQELQREIESIDPKATASHELTDALARQQWEIYGLMVWCAVLSGFVVILLVRRERR